MAGFLYFIPGGETVNQETVDEVGLTDALANTKWSVRHATAGPAGEAGCVLVPKSIAVEGKTPWLGYKPATQEWTEANGGKFWCGIEKENPYTTEDLLKPEAIEGHSVKLGDGKEWIIPKARIFPIGTMLPESLVLGPEGEVIREVIPRFSKYSKKAERIWKFWQWENKWIEEEQEPMSDTEAFQLGSEIMSLNYMISKWGISDNKLFGTDNMLTVLKAFVDIPTLIEASLEYEEAELKKKDVNTPKLNKSNSGTAEKSKSTIQPMQI